MKNMIFVLAMLLTAATAYTQTSRKPANNNTAKEPKENTTTRSRANTGTQRETYDANSRRSSGTVNTTTQTNQQPATRENTRENARESKPVSRENSNVQRNENANHERHNNGVRTNNYQNNNDRESVNRGGSHSRNVVEYESPRVYRNNHSVVHHYHNPPATREYRSVHYVYRRPLHYEVYWTPAIHQHFVEIYPMVPSWHYRHGHRIEMISAYDAMYYRGEVLTVYGEVFEVFYERQTDEFFLYFGAYYPYQDFTVIIPGYLARKYSHRPERFFENQSLAVTGLITTFNGEPEIVVKRSFQLSLY